MRKIVVDLLRVIRDVLNQSNLKNIDPDFYYLVKDFCCKVIND